MELVITATRKLFGKFVSYRSNEHRVSACRFDAVDSHAFRHAVPPSDGRTRLWPGHCEPRPCELDMNPAALLKVAHVLEQKDGPF